MFKFEKEIPFEKRANECKKILERYPNRIPVVCEAIPNAKTTLPPLEKKKFLVPQKMVLGQFSVVIKNQLRVENSTVSLYFSLKDRSSPVSTTPLHNLYSRKKSEDGFLYLYFSEETAFGGREGEIDQHF
eukprot:GEMP01036212.1.p1 GENE.GEMP01036212.1~~GEMP01036212.1.p1  ORF type:complete len:130 (+),score=21.12 GEMP01036212.1:119-508(+)